MTDAEEAAITAICKRALETRVQELRVDLNKAAVIIRRHNIRDDDAVEFCRTAPGCHTCRDFCSNDSREGVCRKNNQQTHAHQICDEWN